MKVSYDHLVRKISISPTITELSEKLLQLGHEHEIEGSIYNIEFTPNRGDCLSVNGLLRDLKLFYEIDIKDKTYDQKIEKYNFKFENNVKKLCSKISFLKVEIDEVPNRYTKELESFFSDLGIKKNNFFTDISNYISYETGQPTHCYDSSTISNYLRLDYAEDVQNFRTLTDKSIKLDGKNLVFFDKNSEIVNLAGVMGGKNTACDKKTRSVIIECAHFHPESIIGKSVKYDIHSEAAHKFERFCDPECHEYVLRRFLKIVQSHTSIKQVEIFTESYTNYHDNIIQFDFKKINAILGTDLNEETCINYLSKLGFIISNNCIQIPSYRNDINSTNDISEEIARAIGYDNILPSDFNISLNNTKKFETLEKDLVYILLNNGFNEVINNPFVGKKDINSIKVDNPLDSNKNYLRTELKDSLLKNLIYNERRQHNIIKLFEISDLYDSNYHLTRRVLGIIASGRVEKNYLDYSKKINKAYIKKFFNGILDEKKLNFIDISRDSVDSKLKDEVIYIEIEIDPTLKINNVDNVYKQPNINDYSYISISEFPSSHRDLSFSITDYSKLKFLEDFVLNFAHPLLKEVFIFDYYKNEKINEIKIGFRFTFQSKETTITDDNVQKVMDEIILKTISYEGITIPGI